MSEVDKIAEQDWPQLTVFVPGMEPYTYPLRRGMTIGRAETNSIVIDHCDVCPEFAEIYDAGDPPVLRIRALTWGFDFRLPSGNVIDDLPLNHETEFYIGEVRGACGPVRAIPVFPEREASAIDAPIDLPALRVACPRCHVSITHLAATARFCARCGLELPKFCPAWTVGKDGASIDLSNPALIAYANALFNLGVRYENVAGHADLAQALRYYAKAARIGIPQAQARLESRELTSR